MKRAFLTLAAVALLCGGVGQAKANFIVVSDHGLGGTLEVTGNYLTYGSVGVVDAGAYLEGFAPQELSQMLQNINNDIAVAYAAVSTPEPASLTLLGIGVASMAGPVFLPFAE